MNNVQKLPKFRQINRQPVEDDDGCFYEKKRCFHPKTIALPAEWDFYLQKYKRVYRIEKSNSEKRFVLTCDNGTWGWDQKGDYVATLKGKTLKQAINSAIKKLPNEPAFFVAGCCEYVLPPDLQAEFEEWYNKL